MGCRGTYFGVQGCSSVPKGLMIGRQYGISPGVLCCAVFLLVSVLEPGRSLTLAEKGGAGAELVVGRPGFLVLATMNPGGDFGKKELSPALSNRFTQVRGAAGGCRGGGGGGGVGGGGRVNSGTYTH